MKNSNFLTTCKIKGQLLFMYKEGYLETTYNREEYFRKMQKSIS